MKINPISKAQPYLESQTKTMRVLTYARDTFHHVVSDKTAVGRFALKHPRTTVVASFMLLAGLAIGAANLFKSDKDSDSKNIADKTVTVLQD